MTVDGYYAEIREMGLRPSNVDTVKRRQPVQSFVSEFSVAIVTGNFDGLNREKNWPNREITGNGPALRERAAYCSAPYRSSEELREKPGGGVMRRIIKPLIIVLPLLVAVVSSAAAQTTAATGAVAGTNLASPYGAVTLPTTTADDGHQRDANRSGDGDHDRDDSGEFGDRDDSGELGDRVDFRELGDGVDFEWRRRVECGRNRRQHVVRGTGSGISSATGTTARSSSVPAWLLCPPAGASGLAPFVTGTDLSCAP